MTTTVQAVYEEDDLLRLLSPLALKKGDQVEVTVSITLAELERAAPDPRRAAEIMAEIAALAVPQGRPETASTDHDRILYGGPEGAL